MHLTANRFRCVHQMYGQRILIQIRIRQMYIVAHTMHVRARKGDSFHIVQLYCFPPKQTQSSSLTFALLRTTQLRATDLNWSHYTKQFDVFVRFYAAISNCHLFIATTINASPLQLIGCAHIPLKSLQVFISLFASISYCIRSRSRALVTLCVAMIAQCKWSVIEAMNIIKTMQNSSIPHDRNEFRIVWRVRVCTMAWARCLCVHYIAQCVLADGWWLVSTTCRC